MMTVGRWSWKSKSAKKCVITYPPNELTPKMDEAKRPDGYMGIEAIVQFQCVGGRGGHDEAPCVNWGGVASSADLGSSSK